MITKFLIFISFAVFIGMVVSNLRIYYIIEFHALYECLLLVTGWFFGMLFAWKPHAY